MATDEFQLSEKFIAYIDILGYSALTGQRWTGFSFAELEELLKMLGSEADRNHHQKYGPTTCPMAPRIPFTFVLPVKSSPYSFTTQDKGLVLRRYRTNACQRCSVKHNCTTSKERLISRWEYEHVLEAVHVGSMSIPRKCASAARRSNIHSAR